MAGYNIGRAGSLSVGPISATSLTLYGNISGTVTDISCRSITTFSSSKVNGDFTVTGTLYVAGTAYTSDLRFKKNITILNDVKSKLFQLMPASYKFRQNEFPNIHFDNQLHFGLIAQDVQKIFPNLVTTIDSSGHLGVKYVEMIPLIIASLKEEDTQANNQQKTIQELEDKIASLENRIATLENSKTNASSTLTDNTTDQAVLNQNVPNPFNASTTISYNISKSFSQAYIGIYDMNGKEIKRYMVQPNSKQIIVPQNTLESGMYIYSLVIDGKLIDSKKMVCTK